MDTVAAWYIFLVDMSGEEFQALVSVIPILVVCPPPESKMSVLLTKLAGVEACELMGFWVRQVVDVKILGICHLLWQRILCCWDVKESARSLIIRSK